MLVRFNDVANDYYSVIHVGFNFHNLCRLKLEKNN